MAFAEDVLARLDRLERPITVRDLPLRALQDRLELDWKPNAGLLLGQRYIIGTGTLTWPGGAALSSSLTVTHGLETTPLAVFVVSHASGAVVACAADTYTPTTFVCRGEMADGSMPAAAATSSIVWAVFA